MTLRVEIRFIVLFNTNSIVKRHCFRVFDILSYIITLDNACTIDFLSQVTLVKSAMWNDVMVALNFDVEIHNNTY